MHLTYLASDVDATTTRSHDKQWLYLYFYKLYNNQTWLDGRPTCTDISQVTWQWIYLQIYKPHRKQNWQNCALIFSCRYGDIITTRSYDQRLCFYLYLCKPYNNQTPQKGRPGCNWLAFADVNAAAITRSCDPNLWLYLQFQKPPNN